MTKRATKPPSAVPADRSVIATGWLALEFESFMNTLYGGDPPEERSAQYKAMEHAFFFGAAKAIEHDRERESLGQEIVEFLKRRKYELEQLKELEKQA